MGELQNGVGALLAKCREDAGLTQRYMAVKAKCTQAYISMVERDEKEAAGLIDLYIRETGHAELCMLNLNADVQSVAGVVKKIIKLGKIEAVAKAE